MGETAAAKETTRRVGAQHGDPPPFMIRDADSFGWGVFHQRHPALVRQLCESLPYSPRQRAALEAHLDPRREENNQDHATLVQ